MMKTLFSILFSSIFLMLNVNAQALVTNNDSLSYSLGVLVAKNLHHGGYEKLNLEVFIMGLRAAMNNEQTLLESGKCEQFVQDNATKTKMKQHESNKLAGEQFLAANKTKAGVISLDNGLQYEIIREGNGPKPKITDTVEVHYHGTLPDGTIFDSSVNRGESISFPLKGVIRGWTEILQLMPVGSKWKVYIPYHLAYGERSAGPDIKPYSALIFEIDLLGIE